MPTPMSPITGISSSPFLNIQRKRTGAVCSGTMIFVLLYYPSLWHELFRLGCQDYVVEAHHSRMYPGRILPMWNAHWATSMDDITISGLSCTPEAPETMKNALKPRDLKTSACPLCFWEREWHEDEMKWTKEKWYDMIQKRKWDK